MPVSSSPARLRFARFELDLTSGELYNDSKRVPLPPKSFEILRALAEYPGAVVTRDELRNKLWSTDTNVEFDDGLNHAVQKLRQVLGDSAEHPQFIETLPRFGYRFIARVDIGSGQSPARKPLRLSPFVITALAARARRSQVPAIRVARLYAHAGDKENTLRWLRKSYEQHEMPLTHIRVAWDWGFLREDPRFQSLLHDMNLTQ
jgi:DNA-binding winged helix-turn-helix (wHTH) protein